MEQAQVDAARAAMRRMAVVPTRIGRLDSPKLLFGVRRLDAALEFWAQPFDSDEIGTPKPRKTFPTEPPSRLCRSRIRQNSDARTSGSEVSRLQLRVVSETSRNGKQKMPKRSRTSALQKRAPSADCGKRLFVRPRFPRHECPSTGTEELLSKRRDRRLVERSLCAAAVAGIAGVLNHPDGDQPALGVDRHVRGMRSAMTERRGAD